MKIYQIVALTTNGKLWQSDICYDSYEKAKFQRIALLKDTQNLSYVTIKELIVF